MARTRLPDHATGAALRRLEDGGSDLARPMEMDFFVAVRDRITGEKVATRARELGYATSVEQDTATGAWTCYCTRTLVPAPAAVSEAEAALDALARELGGYSDGFGSFGNAR